MTQRVVVRRARRRDLETIMGIMNSSRWLDKPITENEALIRLAQKGYWLAISRVGAALAGWQAENLVTCVDDLFVYPPNGADWLGPPLLAEVESAAKQLECEICAVLVPARGQAQLDPMLVSCGYRSCRLGQLDRIWQEVLAQSGPGPETSIWVKQIRAERVIMPI